MSNPPAAYTGLQKHLHWAVVLLLLLQYVLFDGMGRPFHQLMDGAAAYSTTVIAHIAIGVAVLLLALWRLALRARHGAPAAPAGEPRLFAQVSKVAHGLLYVFLIGLPVIGLVAWFGKLGAAAEAHEIGTTVLMWLALLHVAAVVVHQFWWKTNLLRRMV